MFRSLLAHPLARDLNIDDPNVNAIHRQVIQSKPFLRRIYHEWYAMLANDVPVGEGRVLELGSGAGFLRDFIPDVITSEIFHCSGVNAVLDAQQMPLPDSGLRGIVMTDVLHHIPSVRRFFADATRTVRSGGVIAMIEPWYSGWSKLILTNLHHEPFRPEATEWEFATSGPLSGSNQALPWIVFHRDRTIFEREFPQWQIELVRPFMPVRYLISGGVSMRSLVPGFSFGLIKALERPFESSMAMFAHIVLRRR